MSTRAKVYSFLAVAAMLGGGYWSDQKYHWLQAAGITKNTKNDGKKDAKKGSEPEAVPVELAAVNPGQIAAHVSSSGNLRALRDVSLATQGEGIVEKVMAEEGDFVKEGQVLVQIDEKPIRIRLELTRQRLAQARAQIDKAKVREEKAKVQIEHYEKEYDRYNKAHKQGLISETEAERRRLQRDEYIQDAKLAVAEIAELNHRVSELQSEIAQAELDLSRLQLKAPFAGYITRRTVELGQRVRAMEAMFNLGAFSPLYADIFVPEREARGVRPGQSAVIRLGADDKQVVAGRVQRLSPVVDQSSGTVKVTIEVPPAGANFRPGAFVRVDVRIDVRDGVLLIPKRAVIEEDGESYVFVVDSGKASRKKVGIGYESEGMIEVRSGVKNGQQVVIAGQGGLKEGSKIKASKG
ncbi:MAG: efflux RND transporter periplasmic adaptor subunit [Acidobacteria bacterium]|nr:efflux RND transporter periplasmic adaptor subunit [Acidobacteriota bacterium]